MHIDFDKVFSNGYFPSEDGRLKSLPGVKNILVTGGAGFIGGWFVRHMVQVHGDSYVVICFDNLEYCASMNNFSVIKHLPNFHFVKGDICSAQDVERALQKYNVDAIVHFAASSHVDNSFSDPLLFTRTNVIGTQVVLEVARKLGSIKRFIHVSTDEVYGENDAKTPLPSRRISAYIQPTHTRRAKLPRKWLSTRIKSQLIPRFITLLNQGKKMTIHGDGQSTRAFLFASDAAEAFDVIFHNGVDGESYNISSENQLQVREVAKKILKCFGRHCAQSLEHSMELVKDRPFNDSMYWTNDAKLRALGWQERTNFDEALKATVNWYCRHGEGFWQDM
ncbi:uncharacterized protein ATNIH1004_010648 [Aspergillus tanneri]|uniref:NAD(P)-binding domain-containing protein n=1 Tax=Aspergillus tanneri TaxID=1220188 RepID=A0A5M9MFY7_9EURO|nr:uncharacterized protein ATNIH1004_010648 [Aspergillus tanneri]KAA8643873.1 hypothetical protein ATNIH1004_010648 [Aspergillus tanneri]